VTPAERRANAAERVRRWRAENPARIKAIASAARKRNRTKVAAAWKAYYEKNKSELYKKKRAYLARNPEKVKKWKRAEYERHRDRYIARAHKRWREKNDECRPYEAMRRQRDKKKMSARRRDYVRRNREKVVASKRTYAKTPRGRAARLASDRKCVEKGNTRKYAWARRNRHKITAHVLIRRQTDPIFRLKMDVRSRINQALRGKAKLGRTVELLGCSIASYREYLTKLFLPGMSWEPRNFEIHHNQEVSTFALTTSDGQKAAFNYLNTRPLFKFDHMDWHKQRRTKQWGLTNGR
jgi:hypothetical protein